MLERVLLAQARVVTTPPGSDGARALKDFRTARIAFRELIRNLAHESEVRFTADYARMIYRVLPDAFVEAFAKATGREPGSAQSPSITALLDPAYTPALGAGEADAGYHRGVRVVRPPSAGSGHPHYRYLGAASLTRALAYELTEIPLDGERPGAAYISREALQRAASRIDADRPAVNPGANLAEGVSAAVDKAARERGASTEMRTLAQSSTVAGIAYLAHLYGEQNADERVREALSAAASPAVSQPDEMRI